VDRRRGHVALNLRDDPAEKQHTRYNQTHAGLPY
jgi:hypothetical protein